MRETIAHEAKVLPLELVQNQPLHLKHYEVEFLKREQNTQGSGIDEQDVEQPKGHTVKDGTEVTAG
jgi:hypothetical protein